MGELLKLLTLGAVATAAVVVAKEVIERTEKGEDCSPKAVVRGIGKKIGDFCANLGSADDDDEDFDDFEDFELDGEDESLDFGTEDMESDKLDDDGFAAFEQKEAEPAPEVPAEPEASAEVPVEAPAAEATPGETVDEALDSVAKSFEGKGGKSKK